jgi:hypothetical protein
MQLLTRKLARISAVLLVSVVATGCDIAVDGHGGLGIGLATGKASDQWTRTYQVSPGGRLELINVNGRITAESSEGTAIEVHAERSAKATSDQAAKDLLDRVEMREEVGADRVRVEVRAPRNIGPGGHEFTWTVKVPRGVSVDLRTVNGGIRVANLDGDVRARSTNGGIKGTGLMATAVDASVVNGGVDIELVKAVTTGSYEIEAVNGGVSIYLPHDSRADIAGRCVNGGVSTYDLPLETVGEQNRRRVNARLNGGGARVSLGTVNGGVHIRRTGAVVN